MELPGGGHTARRSRARGRVAAATLLAVVVAVSATIFGIGFAPEAHHEDAAGGHGAEAEEAEGASHAEEDEVEGAAAPSILISLAGVALVPLALTPARRRPSQVALAGARRPEERASAVVAPAPVVVALLSIGAAVIHFAVIAQHFDEWWLTGMFFVSLALFQLAWGLLALIRPSVLVYAAGALVNALVVVTWIVSRTVGVPVGPEAGEAEAVGFPDGLATAFEVMLVAVVAFLLARSARGFPRPTVLHAAGWGSAAAVASLTALALVMLA